MEVTVGRIFLICNGESVYSSKEVRARIPYRQTIRIFSDVSINGIQLDFGSDDMVMETFVEYLRKVREVVDHYFEFRNFATEDFVKLSFHGSNK